MKTRGPVPAAGVYAALATPRRPNSTEADVGAFLEYLDRVSGAGVDGLVLFGSTGEFVHFDREERMRVAALALKRSRLPVLVNASHSTLTGALELAEDAMSGGAVGVLLMPPYFYRYGDEEIARYYEEFRESVDPQTPIYLYNLPFFTNPLSTKLLEHLLSSGAFAGIKDSSGVWENLEFLRKLRDRYPFQLLIGHESVYLRGLLAGADGIVSGLSAAVPELVVAIYRAVKTSDIEASQLLTAKLEEFINWLEKFPSTVAIKQAAEARKWMCANLAVPLSGRAQEDLVQFQDWFKRWLPETLQQCAGVAAVRR